MSYDSSASDASTLRTAASSSSVGTLCNANQPNVLRKEGIEYARDSIEFWRPVYKEKARRKRERRAETEERGSLNGFGIAWLSRLLGLKNRT